MSIKTDLLKYKVYLDTLKVQKTKYNTYDLSTQEYSENAKSIWSKLSKVQSNAKIRIGGERPKLNIETSYKSIDIYMYLGSSIAPFVIKEIEATSSDVPLCLTGEQDVLNYTRKGQYVSAVAIENNVIDGSITKSICDYGYYDGVPTNAHGVAAVVVPKSFMSDTTILERIKNTLDKYIPANINYVIINEVEGL